VAETVADTLANVLTKEPPLDQLPAATPPGIRRLVARCLQKDIRKRLQAIGDARIEIDESLAGKDSVSAEPLPEGKVHASSLSRRSAVVIVGSAVAFVAVVLSYVWWTRPVPSPRVLGSTQITRDGLQKISAIEFQSLWTDGSRLYFNEEANGSWGIAQVSALGGETLPFSTSISTPILLSMAPNRSELLAQSLTSNEAVAPLWVVPILGGTPRRIGDVRANDGDFSPDGQHIAYVEDSDIYQANLDGTGSRKLATVSGIAFFPRFSPDGSILRFTVLDSKNTWSIWEVRSDGTGLHPILPDWNKPHNELCGSWTPDGKYYIFEAVRGGTGNSNLWALREKGGPFERTNREPIQLTSGPFDFHMPVPDPNGHKLYVIGVQQRGELVRYDARSQQFQPFLSALGADQVDISADGKWVTYTLYPEGSLWRSKLDGSERLQLTFPPAHANAPRWSPDGKRIAFSIRITGKPQNIYSLPVDGGAPEQLTTGDQGDLDPSWSADGESLVFGQDPAGPGGAGAMRIKILNLKTRQVSIVPGSEGLWRPSFSPDGRHIAALTTGSQAITLFDVATQKWTELARTAVNSPTWSRDGQYIYFDSYPNRDAAIFRLRISDHKLERVTNLEGLQRAESSVFNTYPWLGLTPDDSPILLRDNGTQEIYALDMQLP
jgi:eukaryotic-like serine/threonine-protein kinase